MSFLRDRSAAVAGALLLLVTAAAIIWANSDASGSYQRVWATPLSIGIADWGLSKPLILWVNDFLMAIFFLLVGLEVKREVLQGALSSVRKASLPIAAAVGGVILPSAIYAVVNLGPSGDPSGWPIPAATDIAFALGIVALLGKRVPVALKVFLTTVAVVDDLIAVLIIAVFFTGNLAWSALLGAALCFGTLAVASKIGVRGSVVYIVGGLLLWLFVLGSGLHATLAGVLLAFVVPLGRNLSSGEFSTRLVELGDGIDGEATSGLAPDTVVHRVRAACDRFESPLIRWEHALQPFVLFAIVPIFALANAGVTLAGGGGAEVAGAATDPVGLGVGLGLLVGKPLGVTAAAWAAARFGLAELPKNLSFSQLHAASWLAGIGFTMALFIAGLALQGAALQSARVGLLLGSALAACIGAFLVWKTCAPQAVFDAEAKRNGGPRPSEGARNRAAAEAT